MYQRQEDSHISFARICCLDGMSNLHNWIQHVFYFGPDGPRMGSFRLYQRRRLVENTGLAPRKGKSPSTIACSLYTDGLQ